MTDSKYTVTLLDGDGYDIAERGAETLVTAKRLAKTLISDQWARDGETSHEALGTRKVEVRNRSGECLYDLFRDEE